MRQTPPMIGAPVNWRTPEELIEIGFSRSRVVMMNEAHDGLRRSVATRRMGLRILPAAHAAGCRHLAMEALDPHFAAEANRSQQAPERSIGYLAQPEMRALIAGALELGWTLLPYEADLHPDGVELPGSDGGHWARVNWRDEQQARNLVASLERLPEDARLLVWCGNSHHSKSQDDEWTPMGFWFRELADIDAFAIDQIRGVRFDSDYRPISYWLSVYALEIGSGAGFLAGEAPDDWPDVGVDAYLFLDDNELS